MEKKLDFLPGNNRDRWYLSVSFALPVVLVFLGYLFMGLYPFGDRTILIMDLHGQYFPMINNLKAAMSDGNLLYSFSAGLGFNLIAQNAYYTNSIFWYIIALLPAKAMIPAFQLAVALKFGLAGLTFSLFLKKKFGDFSPLTVALSIAYALCGYTLAYISQTMWADAVFLLPLVILGLESMLEKGRPLLYYVSLSLLIISNFYIGFSVCIFTALYFAVYEISAKRSIKDHLTRTGRFSLWSLFSGGTAAVFLIPTYFAITGTKASSLGFEGPVEFYHTLEEVLGRFIPFSGNELEFGAPNLYCGIFVLICVFLYTFSSSIEPRKRVAHLFLFTFLILSFEVNILDFIMHGLHYPNQLPGRYSFVLAFLALIIAYEAISNLANIRLPYIAISVAAPVLLLAWYAKSDLAEKSIFVAGILLLLMYGVIFMLPESHRRTLASSLVALVIVFEIGCNALYVLGTQSRTYSYTDYTSFYDEMEVLTEKYESGKDDFWRTESTPFLGFNSGQLFGHKGITYYSSMMSGAAYEFFLDMGFGVYAKNVTTIYTPTPITNTMLGVRYLYDRYNDSAFSTLDAKEKVGSTTVRENKYFLPLAFAVSEKMSEFGSKEYSSPFDYQNDMLISTGATDENVFSKMISDKNVQGGHVSLATDGNTYFFKDGSSNVVCSFTCVTDKSGDYFIDSDFRTGTLRLYVNGRYQKDLSTSFNFVHYLGNYPEGTTLKLELTSDYAYALYGLDIYRFDEDVFAKAHEALLPGAVEVTRYSPSKIKATVNVDEDKLLYTSLPDDGGWKIYVDGKKVETDNIADFLLCAKISAGEHNLEFRYTPPGFVPGLLISLACIAAAAAILICKKKKQ